MLRAFPGGACIWMSVGISSRRSDQALAGFDRASPHEHLSLASDRRSGWRLASRPSCLTQVSAWRDRDGQACSGYYTAEEVAEVLRYAQQRHIEVVPGEMQAMPWQPWLPFLSSCGSPFEVANTCGIFDDVYCAGKPGPLSFGSHPCRGGGAFFRAHVHIGGDECPKTR